ncbi:MAG TPA: nuclear transport factor 2 family protein [Sphingomicrobium sp.]|nr:nuclear transport factor 2 family protein [Sphingomicrobium sp.]
MPIGALTYLFAAAAFNQNAASATAPTAPQELETQLTDMEKASWAAWQRMDVPFWENFLSDDHIELNSYLGPVGKQAVVGGISKKVCQVRSYKVDRFTFRQLDENIAILVYRADQDTSCGTVTVPSPNWATSVYRRKGQKWENVLFELTPIAVPLKTSASKTP